MMDLKNAAAALLGRAMRDGAVAAEAWVRRRHSTRCRSGSDAVKRVEALDASIRMRLADGRIGSYQGPIATLDGAVSLVDEAIAGAEKPAHPDQDLPRMDISTMGLGILDRRLPHLDDEARLEVVANNFRALGAAGVEVMPVQISYFEELQEIHFCSNGGIDASDRSSRFSLTAEGRIRENSNTSSSSSSTCRSFADACSVPLGADVARRLLSMGTAAEMPKEPRAVVFAPRVIGELLPKLLPAFEAKRLASGESFLSDSMGESYGNPLVHIIDDATVPGGLQTRPFDARGVPPVPVPLWVEGVPTGRYLDAETASMEGLRPSGHQGLNGELWVGNVIVRPGSRSKNMIFPDLGALLICTELNSARVSLKTGKLTLHLRTFSRGVDGESEYVGDQVMQTTVKELLASVTHLANDQTRHGFVDTPSWVLNGPWFQ